MKSKVALLVLPLLLLASVTPNRLAAQASSPGQQEPATTPPDPSANRAADSRSQSPYLQLPPELQNLPPILPPAPREMRLPANEGDTAVFERATGQESVIAGGGPRPEAAAGQRATVPGFQGLLPSADVDESVQTESILGADGRTHVTAVTSFPYRTVAFAAIGFPGGGSGPEGWCTAEMIDPYHVYTAGHCVHNGANWADYFVIYPGRDQSYMPYHLADWTIMRSYTEWTVNQDHRHDWAVVTLDRNIGNFTGWMGRITATCNFFFCDGIYTGTLNNAGYGSHEPNGAPNNGKMFFDSDGGRTANEHNHWYYMDTLGGNSGGPVWYFDGTNRYITTIHAYGDDGSGSNHGTRLNQDKYDRTITWLNSDTPPVDRPDVLDDGQVFMYASPSTAIRGVTQMSVGSDVRNIGTAAAGGFYVWYVLSSDTFISTSDYFVCQAFVSGVSSFNWANSDCSGIPPANIPPGSYRLGVIYDRFGNLSEFDESNNTAYSSFLVTVTLPSVTVLASDSVATEAGPTTGAFTFVRSGSNASPGNAGPLTVNYSIGGSATNGVDYTGLSGTVTIPGASNAATVFLTPVADKLIEVESVVASVAGGSGYNIGSPSSGTVTIYDGPDLMVKTLTAPVTSGRGTTISISAITSNAGNGPSGVSTTRLYFSTNTAVDAGDQVIGDLGVPGLASGGQVTGSLSFTIPTAIADGTYYILGRADVFGSVPETKETNNVRNKKILIGPDLSISALTAPTSATQGTVITVRDTTKNALGASPAPASTTRVFLSLDNKYDAGDSPLSSRPVPPLNPNVVSSFSHSVTLPAGVTGTRYLIAVADAGNAVVETKETNNNKAKLITLNP